MVAHSRGGRHRPNYQAGARIRPADIDRTHSITMEGKRTQRVATAIQTPCGLVAMAARRARLRCVAFADDDHLHPQPFGFVGEQVPHLPTGHLVDALVAHVPIVFGFPARSQVANSERLDANPVEH